MLGQYYHLKEYLLTSIALLKKKGGWNAIDLDPKFKFYTVGDSSATIGQIRKRLVFSGDLATDSGSNVYDEALKEAVLSYKTRNGYDQDAIVTPEHIADLNIPIGRAHTEL